MNSSNLSGRSAVACTRYGSGNLNQFYHKAALLFCFNTIVFMLIIFILFFFRTGVVQAEQMIKNERLPMQFSALENHIESVTKKYYRQRPLLLAKLAQIESEASNATVSEVAYLLVYRCFLEAKQQKLKQIEKTQKKFSELIFSSHEVSSVFAASALCDAYKALFSGDSATFNLLTEKAFGYISNARSAVLRYWISLAYANIVQGESRHVEAIEAAQSALAIAIANEDISRQIDSRATISISEAELEFYSDALENSKKAINLQQNYTTNKSVMFSLLRGRGYILQGAGHLDEAKIAYQKAIDMAEKLDDENSKYHILTNIAAIALAEKNYVKVIELCLRILDYSEVNKNDYLSAYTQSVFSIALAYKGNTEAAEKLYQQSNQYFEDNKLLDALADNYSGWSEVMAEKKLFEKAYEAQLQFKRINDKLFQSDREKRLLKLKAIFNSNEKDRAIIRLSETNRKQEVEIENRKLQTQIWWLIGVVLLLLIVLLFVVNRKVRESNILLFDENKRLDKRQYVDPLTRSFNRRYFDEQVINKIETASTRQLSSITFYLLDIDYFKLINDTHGHATGDEVLKQVVERLKDSVRDSDMLVRWGGEEFLLAVENISVAQGKSLSRKLLTSLSRAPVVTSSAQVKVTASIGAVHIDNSRQEIDIMKYLELVDQALYLAKENGRNQVSFVEMLKSTGITQKLKQAQRRGQARLTVLFGRNACC